MFVAPIYFVLFCILKSALSSVTVYVVPSLSKVNKEDGTLEYPFSTIQHARDSLRQMNRSFYRQIALYPTYHFLNNAALTFDSQDHHISFIQMTHYEQNKIPQWRLKDLVRLDMPIVSGGIRLSNWTNDKGIWKMSLPDTFSTVTQLFVDGQRAIRSRLPTSGYFIYEQGLDNRTQLAYRGFIYREHQFDDMTLSSTSTSEFIVYHSLTTSRHFFSTIFPTNRTVIFSNPSLSIIGNQSIIQQSGQRYHLENIYEGMLIQEKSFYFDSKENILYYHPQKTEDPETTIVILPVLETILSIRNVNNMKWDSIGFQHSSWILSSANKTEPIDGRAAADYLDRSVVTIYIENSSAIQFNNIDIGHVAGYAMQIDANSKDINISNSQMYDLGAGGIRIGIGTDIRIKSKEWTENIQIKNCTLYDGGHLFPMGVAILVQRQTKNIVIIGNTLYQFFYSAIHIGWSWSYDESSCYSHTVSNNYIHHIGRNVLSELAGIYTCGLLNQTLISNNIVHDIYGYFLSDWGLCLADGTSQLEIRNTIVYNTGSAGLCMIYGFNNTFENNILARSSSQSDGALSLYRRESLDHLSFTFQHNIIYDTVDDVLRWIFQVQAPDPFSAPYVVLDYNCYFSTYATPMIFGLGRLIFSEWKETGHDEHSLITDPLFIDAEKQCNFFNLNVNSPAVMQLRFKPIKQLLQWKPGC